MPPPDRYLRTSLLVVRHPGGSVLLHPGSSVVLLVDPMGAQVAVRLIRGKSESEVRVWVESRIPDTGAGERVAQLIDRLQTIGAMTTSRPERSFRWRWRSSMSLTLGRLLSLASAVLPMVPVGALRALIAALPRTPLVAHTVGQIQRYVDANLRASGYEDTTEQWRLCIAQSCAAASALTFTMMYLALVLPKKKLLALLRALFDQESFAELTNTLRGAGGGVLAALHTSLHTGVIALLAAEGLDEVVIADVGALGVNLNGRGVPGLAVLGEHVQTIVDSHSRLAGRQLLERLHAGNLVVLAFDAPPQGSNDSATKSCIPFLGRQLYRFDGPAWLAVRSGKPIIFAATYQEGNRVAVHVRPPLYPTPGMSRRAQAAELTGRLYAEGESFLRQHPDAWMGWSYMHDLVVLDEARVEHGECGDDIEQAPTR